MKKLSRKDIEMLEMLATTAESDDKLAEYIHHHKKAVKAYKAFREAVLSGFEVQTDSELLRMINSLPTVGEVTSVIEYKNGVPSRYVSDDEVKRKFKAGDKVRVLDVSYGAATSALDAGDITEVVGYKDEFEEYELLAPEERPVVVVEPEGETGLFEESALELVVEEKVNQ